jgi:3-oxoacyl-(acyl-carrier-protein) synthase
MREFPEDTFIIWTGVKGNVEYIENNFKNKMPHLPHHYRKWVCDYINRPEAKGMEINAACASSTIGIILGSMAISSGLYSSVLVCAADIVSSFVHMGFSSLKALTKTKAKPFDKNRDGLNLGDGAVASLLVNEEVAQKMEIGERIRVTGWGISNDANHITGPARDGCGLIEAMQGALRVAGKKPEDIEAFCAHGTSTVYNDAMELYATDFIFKDRKFPVFSIKGSIGHTLGAAGAIEAAISAESLKKGIIPPTVGLSDPEDSAVGRVSDSVTPIPGNNILTTNSGFGGVNAALILEKE